MDATDLIAGYAALVATAAVAWPIWQARKTRRPDVSSFAVHSPAAAHAAWTSMISVEVGSRG
jgi:hypothetical protein